VGTNPQKQTQQSQQPQQLQEGVVLEVSNLQPASEQVQQQPRPNGAQAQSNFQAPSQTVVDPAHILKIQGEGRKVVIDMSNDAGMREFFARQAEADGYHAQAASLRG
jgi:hypothetical protein